MADEQWRPVVGYEGLYEVSDHGNLRSCTRAIARTDRQGRSQTCTRRGSLLRLQRQRLGYVGTVLWRDGGYRNVRVHQLVLEAFAGPCPPNMETRHLNGVRHDNRLDNLRWGTREENAEDRFRHKWERRGQDPGRFELLPDDSERP